MIYPHNLTLRGPRVTLRPFTEADLHTVLTWFQDEEVLSLSEGNDLVFHSVDDIRPIYNGLHTQGYLFIIEADGHPIGECTLQRMNLAWVNERYPGEHIYRLPIMIGDKRYWGRGYGTEVVRLLLEYAFQVLDADRFFIPGVWAFNERSLNLWKHFGFGEVERQPETLNRWGTITQTEAIHLTLTRAEYEARRVLAQATER